MYDPNPPHGPYDNTGGAPGDSSPGLALGVGIATLICCNLIGGILGTIFAAVAMGQDDPYEKDRFVKYAWIGIIAGFVLTAIPLLFLLPLL